MSNAKTIKWDGEEWRVNATGNVSGDGKTKYCHLVSVSRGRQTKAGWYPVQMADWIPVEFL